MVQFTDALLFALMTATARAAPLSLSKRIAQTTIDAVTPWENACDSAGGGQQCNTIAVTAASTLLAAAGNCDQQNSGDAMVNLAKQLNNNQDMITLAQIFVQQPRNSPNSQAVPYCQSAPQNSELNGLFQCQFQGSDQTTFVGGVAAGGNSTVPFGQSAVNPPGSCPANPSGPVPDGEQLNQITQNPGVAGSTGSASSSTNSTGTAGSSTGSSTNSTGTATGSTGTASTNSTGTASTGTASTGTGVDNSGSGVAAGASSVSSAAGTSASSTTGSSSTSSSSGFALSNGQQAQALNAQFATLTASSSCTEGQDACVNGAFAQCSNGAFATTTCAGGTPCFALPLVNKAGTSVTCTTQSDAESRIAATGATGGVIGNGSGGSSVSGGSSASGGSGTIVSTPPVVTVSAAATNNAATTSSSTSSFALSNGQDAQKLNAQFATLTASSSCTDGENACVNGAFAQCSNGAFATTSCAGGTSCFALPLVNSAGTSVTCTTQSDAESRIAATGATGGVTGSS